MGITILPSTIDGGYTPICNSCMITLCWDISEEEYQEEKWFWDNWTCKECKEYYEKPSEQLFWGD